MIVPNLKTTCAGIVILVCELIGLFKPAYQPACKQVEAILIGVGLIAAADSHAVLPTTERRNLTP